MLPHPKPAPPAEDDWRLDEEHERVTLWRVQRFLFLGCNRLEAELLASADADWHEADRLMQAGCTPDQLVRLLS